MWLALGLLPAAAQSELSIRIDARVEPDLRTVIGVIEFSGDATSAALVDPLALLPDPRDDLQGIRTFPGAASHGSVTWQAAGPGRYTFVSTLPRRYGAVGATHHGLFASGAWYPQPITVDGLPRATFDVHVTLPPGAVGAVGDVVGAEAIAWTGKGERAALAVVPRGVVTLLEGPGDVSLLTRGRARRVLARELSSSLSLLPLPLQGVVVEAPLRRRLTRHAPGLVYVSDRAFRLTPGVRFAHRRAVPAGLAAGLLVTIDPLEREVAAAGLGQIAEDRLQGIRAERLLGAFSWIPQVNSLLASERMAFYGEVFGRTWPTDPVHDDLCEILDPYTPGRAVVAQLDDRHGPGTGRRVAELLAIGVPAEEALASQGVDADFFTPWRAEPVTQDYRLDVRGGSVSITREAPTRAPPEILVVTLDDERRTLELAPGSHGVPVDGAIRQVALDPARHLEQSSRAGDTWPARYDWTASAAIDSIDLSLGQVFASGWLTLRRRYDTHNLWLGSLSNSSSDLISAQLGYLRKEGSRLDGWSRPHRVRSDVSLSLLDPSFAATDGLALALDGKLSYAWDSRVSGEFPIRGKRLGVALGGGGIPDTDLTWTSVNVAAVGLASLHPRQAFAGRVTGAVARSALPHRLLTLGGDGAMRSIPALPACPATDDAGEPLPCTPVATERAVGMVELRLAPIRGWSVPLALAWGSELQIALGLEGLLARVDDAPAWATGATVGLYGVGDVLGAETMGVGVTAAWPLAWDGVTTLEATLVPALYLRFGQAF